ncbi:MAG: bifunctional UDP-3-O-[3-hydroxymyristoyl] N-acetylglucosamine deacetylase/3-hydroxyacyl-ACP dehydratase [Verrucomicrobia bacterium]|nr:bifunctional UDP-3-O-[3-hydroxymyristoyl] N-acetylglucosamine deacetylase/3-hydroxyacyl-ACP dehydratase [Verrucomicrobiota bacterium]
MFKQQQTFKKSVSFSGVGLHTGNAVTMTFKPAAADTGIRFKRMDLDEQPEVEALVANVVETTRGTTIGKGNMRVHTIEHVMAAFHAMGVDNAVVELDANEPPVGDGSAEPYLKMIAEAGLVEQDGKREVAQITEPIWFKQGDSTVVMLPAERLQVSCTISFPVGGMDSQYFSLGVDRESFAQELAPSRTFCFFHEVEHLMKAGLIKGGSLENANIVRGESVLTQGGLRFRDEFVRHKILDIIGDIYLLGRPVAAQIIAIRPGHTVNYELTKQLAQKAAKPAKPPAAPAAEAAAPAKTTPPPISDAGEVDSVALLKMVPHRYPFVMLDRVLKLEAKKAVAIKNVSINEPYFQGHFPGHPVMPGVLQLEAMAQCGGIMLLKGGENAGKLAFFMSADNVKYRKPVTPGDQLLIEAELTAQRRNIGRAKCTCKVGGEVVSEAELMFLIHG